MIGARKNIQKAIKIHRGLGHTDSNPEMATLIHNLGTVMQQEGDTEGAKKQFETSLKMFEDVHGEDVAKNHPHIAILKHNLGRVYQSSGDLTAAREHLESSLEISKKVYGDGAKHPEIGNTLLGLEELDRKMGRITEAEYRKKAAKKILDVMFKERRGTCIRVLFFFIINSLTRVFTQYHDKYQVHSRHHQHHRREEKKTLQNLLQRLKCVGMC